MTKPELPLKTGLWTGQLKTCSPHRRVYLYRRPDGWWTEVLFSSVVVWQRTCYINSGVNIVKEDDGAIIPVGSGRKVRGTLMIAQLPRHSVRQRTVFWSLDPKGRTASGGSGYLRSQIMRTLRRDAVPVFVRFVTPVPPGADAKAKEIQEDLIARLYPHFGVPEAN